MFESARAFGFTCPRRTAILASLAALFFAGDCLAQATPGPGAATTPPAPAAPPTVQEVTISGNPSLLRVANSWWGELTLPCATFRVTAVPSVAVLELYTNGLGQSLLLDTATNQGTKCPDIKSMHDRINLTNNNTAAGIDRFVTIMIDTSPLTTPSAFVQGSVMALAGSKKVSEFALKVERAPRDEIWTAITWMLTIVIPAAITFGVTRAATSFTARQKEIDDFRSYRLANMKDITDFIENDIGPVIGTDIEGVRVGGLVFDLFKGKKEILSRIPDYRAKQLMKALSANDAKRIVKVLKRLFPEATQSL